MYRPEKPAPTTTASNCSGTEAGLFTRRSLEVPELGKGGFDCAGGFATVGACWALPLTLTQLHKCANACRSDSLWRATPAGQLRSRPRSACQFESADDGWEHAMGKPATAENAAGGAQIDMIGVPFDGMGRASGQAGAPEALRGAGLRAVFAPDVIMEPDLVLP